MNDGISEVFNVIKSHCKKNGNPVFEEVVVVDLLKDLVPEHGPNQAAGIIIEMLDAQRISDCNNQIVNENPTVENEAIEDVIDDDNNDSNDGSIVEVEVPKKIYPCIDLTDASPLSVIIEDSTNSEYVKHEKDEVSYLSDDYNADSYGSLQYDDSSDIDASISASCNPRPAEHPLIHLLSDLDESCKSYQSLPDNNSNVEISEILEENNNDPNNNLEGAIFEQPAEVHHLQNTNVSEQSDMDISLPTNSNAVYSVIEEMIDSIPGCSKDTDVDVMNRMYKFNKSLPSTSSSASPVPGCSKNVPDRILNSSDDESELDVLISKDETIQNDAMCIHEIIPWADILTIIRILKKHYNSSNRKQQTLWDLMSQQSSKSNNVPVKRKLSTDACSSSIKSLKKDDSKNETTVSPQGDNTTSNKSSDQLSADYEIPNVNELKPDNFFKTSHTSKNTDQSMLPSSNRSIVLDKTANQSPANLNIRKTHHPEPSYNCLQPFYIKGMSTPQKERNETVVSGILSSQKPPSNPLPLRVMDASTSHHSSSKEQFASVIKNPSSNSDKDKKSNILSNNCNSFVLGRPKKEPLCDINHGIDPRNNRLLQPQKELNKKPEELLKPAKFVVNPPAINLVTNAKKPIVDTPVHPAVLNALKPDPDRQVFPVNHNPSVAQKIFSRDQVPNFSQFLDRDAELRRLNNNRYQLEVQKREPSFLRPSVFEPPTIAKRRTAPATITATEAAKLEATVTKTASSTNTLPTRNENSAAVPQPSTSTAPTAVVNKTEVPNSVYVKLRSMFPEVKKSYIKHICTKPPIVISNSDANYTLSVLVDHLLREGQNNLEVEQMQLPKDEQPTVSLSVDEKYEYLLGLFPNADPTYLRDVVEKTCITDQSLEEFIQQKIESHDYPTKEQYLAKIKMTEQLKQYTSNFKVESFLELFPDPFKHFEDAKRECMHQTIALEFLKSFFNRNKVQTIAHLYKEQKYNLSLTAKRLSVIGQDMKTRRGNCEMITENIPLLQEITFIKNKQKILDHINAIRTREETLFKELKNKGMLMTCLCCYNDECMPTKSMECNSGHAFCHECIIRGTEATLANAEAHVKCFTECTSEFSLATLQKVLPPTMFSALLKKRQAAEVAAAEVEGLVSCPFCYFASIPPPEDKVFKCLNPECMKESCRLCKELNHVPMRCDEVTKTDEARRLIEEKMTEALLRTCYKCKKQFYKEEGCNKMTCPCGALMCYVCDKPVSGYSHFNAQGGVNADLCPLWSDDRRLNAEAVRRVAEETKNSILKNNPNLKIDTDALLPKIPEKSRGPHDDIPNANQLPEHVRRVITK